MPFTVNVKSLKQSSLSSKNGGYRPFFETGGLFIQVMKNEEFFSRLLRSVLHSLRFATVVLISSLIAITATAEFVSAESFSVKPDSVGPHQPYSSYWFIDELLSWEPESDPHLRFNKSHVPLAERMTQPATQQTPTENYRPQLMTLVSVHPTSEHPSQGFRSHENYVFPFWQHIDHFVMWGGSASEGVVLTPSVPLIDAAHRNGVRVYGTVFFPPEVYGGKTHWVKEFLVCDAEGRFLVADKLIQVANVYGFDGWFLNQETEGCSAEDATLMRQFLAYYQRESAGRLRLIWYDAMTMEGKVKWQRELNDRNADFFQLRSGRMSDSMFLDFKWTEQKLRTSALRATELDRSRWELFAGVDVEKKSYKTSVDWTTLFNDTGPNHTSIALYRPESTRWLASSREPAAVYEEELKFWNGGEILDSDGTPSRWEGFSKFFPAHSVISKKPFVTRFNYGAGTSYFEAGESMSDKPWHNHSNQDILPTWQWRGDSEKLRPRFDFETAYNGGSSLRIAASLKASESVVLPLYKTKLSIHRETMARIVRMIPSKDISLSLVLTLEDGEGKSIELPLKDLQVEGWGTSRMSLEPYVGETIASIGLRVTGDADVHNEPVYLGELAIVDAGDTTVEVPQVSVEVFESSDCLEAYVCIKESESESAWYHDFYRERSTDKWEWLGRTSSNDYYIARIPKPTTGGSSCLVIRSTDKTGKQSEAARVQLEWRNRKSVSVLSEGKLAHQSLIE